MEFLCRACLAALFAIVAHQFRWEGLRFLTSESVLRLSALLGMKTARISFDTIELQGQLFQYVVSCTFAEVFVGGLPAIWRLDSSLLKNLLLLVPVEAALFAFNVARLELGQIAYSHGVPWILAHDIALGLAYFAVIWVIWRKRSWRAWQYCTVESRLGPSPGPGGVHPGEVTQAQGADGS